MKSIRTFLMQMKDVTMVIDLLHCEFFTDEIKKLLLGSYLTNSLLVFTKKTFLAEELNRACLIGIVHPQ